MVETRIPDIAEVVSLVSGARMHHDASELVSVVLAWVEFIRTRQAKPLRDTQGGGRGECTRGQGLHDRPRMMGQCLTTMAASVDEKRLRIATGGALASGISVVATIAEKAATIAQEERKRRTQIWKQGPWDLSNPIISAWQHYS